MAKTVKWPSSHVPITWVASIKTLCSRCGHSVAHEQSIWFGHFFRPWCHHTDLEVSFRPCIPLHHLVALLELLEPWAYHLPWDIPVKTALQPKSKMDRLLQFVGFSVWALFKKHRHIMQSIKPLCLAHAVLLSLSFLENVCKFEIETPVGRGIYNCIQEARRLLELSSKNSSVSR